MALATNTDAPQFYPEREQEYALASMQKYFATKPEQVKLFEELITPSFADQPDCQVLDACCGIGDLTYFLSLLAPRARFVGIDNAPFLIEQARQRFDGNPQITFQEADIYALSKQFAPQSFDLALCKQTLSWLPTYRDAVRELMKVTRRAVFASSLFYDGRIDFETRVREHVKEAEGEASNAYYNVYSFPVFREFCLAEGAQDVVGFDFKIEIDLPRPATLDRMGTYTLKMENGERLQVSGALLMPWKIVRIDL